MSSNNWLCCPKCHEVSPADEVHLISRVRLDLRKQEIIDYYQSKKEDNKRYMRGEDGSTYWGEPPVTPQEYKDLVLNNAICPKCARGCHYGVWMLVSGRLGQLVVGEE